MILLDTNVVSEAMKPAPDEAVRAWLDEQGVYPVAAIRWAKRYSHTKATCTVLAYPERVAA